MEKKKSQNARMGRKSVCSVNGNLKGTNPVGPPFPRLTGPPWGKGQKRTKRENGVPPTFGKKRFGTLLKVKKGEVIGSSQYQGEGKNLRERHPPQKGRGKIKTVGPGKKRGGEGKVFPLY